VATALQTRVQLLLQVGIQQPHHKSADVLHHVTFFYRNYHGKVLVLEPPKLGLEDIR
jgi:hypothetical protein